MDEQLQKYFFGELSQPERFEFLQRMKDDTSLQQQFIEFQNLSALLELTSHEDDESVGKSDYADFIEQRQIRNIRKSIFAFLGYAAAIMLLIVTTWWSAYYYFQHKVPEETMNTLFVPAGQRARLVLQDGTEIWLNAQSTLTYPSHFSGKERRVSLIGEAFFKVAKNPDKPFFVSTKQVEMEVLGTQFNVHSYKETNFVETSLIEGSVKVSTQGNSPRSVILQPNQQVVVENGRMNVKNIDHFSYFSWKEGIYSFENESFKNIIRKLELYYDVKIVLKDSSIQNFVYTGKFRQSDGIDEILHIIQKIHRFKIARNEDRTIITLSR